MENEYEEIFKITRIIIVNHYKRSFMYPGGNYLFSVNNRKLEQGDKYFWVNG